MTNRLRGLINDNEAAYLKILIVGRDSVAAKNALQRLCKLYRDGARLRDDSEMRVILLGSLVHSDPKVIRWALNGLAFLARAEDDQAVISAISTYRDNPDILGAGVAALASLKSLDQLRDSLDGIDLPLRGAALFAAAQQIKSLEPDLRSERVSIDTTDYGALRLATVLVGVNKAPEHLFESGHENSVMLGELNRHPDPLTAQYSIWAITERAEYSIADLKIPLQDAGSTQPNIRAYIYQLVAEDADTAKSNIDFLKQGIEDGEREVRDHLARGLKATYFDGIRSITENWFLNEDDEKTRLRILDHICCQSDLDQEYLNFALNLFTSDNLSRFERAQIEASAGKKLGFEIRRFQYTKSSFEFRGELALTSTVNIGSLNSGVVAINGNASNSGQIGLTSTQAIEQSRSFVSKVCELAAASKEPIPAEISEAFAIAKDSPNKSNISKILGWLKSGAKIGGTVLAAVGVLPDAISGIEALIPLLPST